MYERKFGDNLCNKDKRLRLKWKWSRIASQIPDAELRKWTHFQCSFAEIAHWELEATQWGSKEEVDYKATISFDYNRIKSSGGHKTRLAAQIAAEELLLLWLREQVKDVEQALKEK